MTVFFVLIGMGVVFLLYVLTTFWKDGHQAKSMVREPAARASRGNQAEVIVITHPIPQSAPSTTSRRMIEIPVKKRYAR